MTITTRRTEPFSFGRMIPWWIAAPPTKEARSVNANAGQYPQPWFVVSVQAMYVENVAISPCAKLMTPVARLMRTSASASEA